MMDEAAAIARVLGGDTEPFRVLVERYQRPVVRMVANLIDDRHACEDVGQEVFLAAYRSLASFDPARSSFSTWLFTIARNKTLSLLKKRRHGVADHPVERPDRHRPDEGLTDQEFNDALNRGLAALPAPQRTAFVLAEIEELPYETIAQIEGVAVGTVRSRISRAKGRLRSLLGRYVAGAT